MSARPAARLALGAAFALALTIPHTASADQPKRVGRVALDLEFVRGHRTSVGLGAHIGIGF